MDFLLRSGNCKAIPEDKKIARYIKNSGSDADAIRTVCFFDDELTIRFLNSTRIIRYEDIKSIKQIGHNVWIVTENEYIYMLLKDELQEDWKKSISKIEEKVNKRVVISNRLSIKIFLLRAFITIVLICIIHCGLYKTVVYAKIMDMSDKYYEIADDSVDHVGYYAEKAAYKDLSWAYRSKISFNDYKNLSNDAECMDLYKKIIDVTPPDSEKNYSILSSGKRGVAYDKLKVEGKTYIVKHTFEFNAGYIMCKPYISRWLITIEECEGIGDAE